MTWVSRNNGCTVVCFNKTVDFFERKVLTKSTREKVDKLEVERHHWLDGRVFHVMTLLDRAFGKTPLDRTAK